MATTMNMPKLGMTMEEGTITRWFKSQGEPVQEGELLLEIQTDKVNLEVESPASGVLLAVLAGEGQVVPVNQPIAIIGQAGEPVPPQATEKGSSQTEERVSPIPTRAAAGTLAAGGAGQPIPDGRVRATPVARRLARERGIALNSLKGSGPNGRVTRRDVEAAIIPAIEPPVPPAAAPARVSGRIPLAGIRKVVAERMAYSARTAPHVTLTTEAVASGLVALREQLLPEMERRSGLRPSYTDLLVLLASRALREHPGLNATLRDGVIELLDEVNVGVAVALENGLIVPVVKGADRLSLTEITRATRDLVERARSGGLKSDDYSGGTFTITNLGTHDIDAFTPIINPPESAILGVGRIVEKPVVEAGQVVIRPTMWLSLSFDHRALDGVPAAQFLKRVKELVESPARILM